MKVKFCGAAREVTGSAHLLTLDDGFTILLDCGMFQGYDEEMEELNNSWFFEPKDIDCVILSHGHIDHTGKLPKLWKDGFRGTIYATHATRSLCSIMLMDSAFIQERDAEYYNKRQQKKDDDFIPKTPLYTTKDVKELMNLFVGMSYDKWFSVNDAVKMLYKDAGHILGSASVTLEVKENNRTIRFGFTGDIGRPNRPILRDPQIMPEVDYLICESTYGDKEHEQAPAEIRHFWKIIYETCVERKGKLIIPAFSIGRTQEIVYILDQMESKKMLPHIPVYVDSPLAVNASEIYGSHPECFDEELTKYVLRDNNPFGFNSLTYNQDLEFSKELNTTSEPCIIISASGMMNAGRVKHHLFNSIESSKNTILIVGYCSPETPGGKLRAGEKKIRLFGKEMQVRANIEIMDSFSAHADQSELTTFLTPLKKALKKIFLVHGSYEKQLIFKDYLNRIGFSDVVIPELGEAFVLE